MNSVALGSNMDKIGDAQRSKFLGLNADTKLNWKLLLANKVSTDVTVLFKCSEDVTLHMYA